LAVGSSAAAGFFWIPVLTQTTYSTLKDALNVKVCQSWQVWPSKWASRVSDKGQLLCVHNFVGCTYNLKDLNNTKCAHSRTCTDNLKDLKTTKGAHSRTCTDNLKDLKTFKGAHSRTYTCTVTPHHLVNMHHVGNSPKPARTLCRGSMWHHLTCKWPGKGNTHNVDL
jgi:hypothetical protein